MDSIFVIVLFLIYLILWETKRRRQLAATGINPKVIDKAKSSAQKYVNGMFRFITIYAVGLIAVHTARFDFSWFAQWPLLDSPEFDLLGFAIGITGLGFCLYAQWKMGNSWRVGLDESHKTDLITDGLYRYLRNPTYLGLMLLFGGVWVIWPDFSVAIMFIIYLVTIEFQVRCEEDFLLNMHGEIYLEYFNKTKRYLPFIY